MSGLKLSITMINRLTEVVDMFNVGFYFLFLFVDHVVFDYLVDMLNTFKQVYSATSCR